MSQIFISYSHKDSDYANTLAHRLESQGFRVWIDYDGIRLGEQWGLEIGNAIEQSDAMLILWSENSAPSKFVEKEFLAALQKQHRTPDAPMLIILVAMVALDKLAPHDRLKDLQAVVLPDLEDKTAFGRLINRLKERIPYRHLSKEYDPTKPLGDHANHIQIGNSGLVGVPFMESGRSRAHVIGAPELVVRARIQEKPVDLQLCVHGRGKRSDFTFIEQIATQFADKFGFFALYITPIPQHDEYEIDNNNPGMWLDIVNTAYAAAEELVGRGGSSTNVQVFALAVPAVLMFALGTKFYEYWRLQMYNYVKNGYRLVLDTRDL